MIASTSSSDRPSLPRPVIDRYVRDLLNATTALWMVLIDWLIYQGTRPNRMIFLGLLLGLAGAANGGKMAKLALLSNGGASIVHSTPIGKERKAEFCCERVSGIQ